MLHHPRRVCSEQIPARTPPPLPPPACAFLSFPFARPSPDRRCPSFAERFTRFNVHRDPRRHFFHLSRFSPPRTTTTRKAAFLLFPARDTNERTNAREDRAGRTRFLLRTFRSTMKLACRGTRGVQLVSRGSRRGLRREHRGRRDISPSSATETAIPWCWLSAGGGGINAISRVLTGLPNGQGLASLKPP